MLRRLISLLAVCSLFLVATASTISFNVLTISVHGISTYIVPGDKGQREKDTKYIGQAMSRYDYGIVNVQEDFNYHATLYKYARFPFRTATSGGALFGTGLNTLSKYDWVDFSRLNWDQCGSAFADDCMIHRGFTYMRVRMRKGVYVDMYNLRASNGAPDDITPRHTNIKQLADFIDANSAGNAVIVFGDTYSRYTNAKDNIRILTTQNGLTDAWVQAIGGNPPAAGTRAMDCPKGVPHYIKCEVGEKVFYRGSRIINLNSTGFFYDTARFASPEGKPLTDYMHHPVRVEFAYNPNDEFLQSILHGGYQGTWFNDLAILPEAPVVSSIILRGASRLDRLIIVYTSNHVFQHGGWGGSDRTLYMDDDEYIKSFEVCWGQRGGNTSIFYARVVTNRRNAVQVGTRTESCAVSIAPSGHAIVGTYGKAGSEINRLGFIYAFAVSLCYRPTCRARLTLSARIALHHMVYSDCETDPGPMRRRPLSSVAFPQRRGRFCSVVRTKSNDGSGSLLHFGLT
ncbi:endonuclease/exonuclease/phosphatase family protein [Rhizoctonia solani 123E]|uniref:Endonuclease/exonuclease/phosphatase family protein n=1 Tax=Rhizoctonia solani 123E TaxID=1423351 RepID=A0A074RMT3_9AGAM|nr:endonuclease/exonuclease/phosphatase family protein [Rhizoctonia solani 123E]